MKHFFSLKQCPILDKLSPPLDLLWWLLSRTIYCSVVKRFMTVFLQKKRCRRVLLDPSFDQNAHLTFHFFWVKVPLSQYRPALLCSKIARQISHENEWFYNLWFIFEKAYFLIKTYIPKGPSINYVVSKSGIFDPLPPLSSFLLSNVS